MTRQVLNRGTVANDGTGDTLRTAAQKINENFSELYLLVGGDSAVTSVRLIESGISFEGLTEDDYETYLIAAEPTADRTVTIPNATGTIVLDTTTQTLTNKTLTSPVLTTPQINDTSADHQYIFAVGELSADRTVTLPVLSSNDTFVFANATQTLNNKTINGLTVTNPIIGGLSGGALLLDSSSNEYIKFSKTASAVNYITLSNSATGSGPTIDVEGTDTNIGLNLGTKGTGGITFKNKLVLEKGTDVASSTSVNLTEPLTVFNSGSLISPTIANGSSQGETKYFINIGTGEVRLTPSGVSTNIQGVDSGSGFISFDEGDGCQLIWNSTNSKWYIVSNNGITTG